MTKENARTLLLDWIPSPALRHHCEMVATATEGYAKRLGKSEAVQLEWWLAGLLHDLDWEKYPDEHPQKALQYLKELQVSDEILNAIEAHAPHRTGRFPCAELERYLFACDELSGFMHAVSLMRPNRFADMEAKSVIKKLKDRKFAEAVSRDDIEEGARLIEVDLNTHIETLIQFFRQ